MYGWNIEGSRARLEVTAGSFYNSETDVRFEFGGMPMNEWAERHGIPHTLWLCNDECRPAIIKKTVAYIAKDEDEYGNPIFEKWAIKKFSDWRR